MVGSFLSSPLESEVVYPSALGPIPAHERTAAKGSQDDQIHMEATSPCSLGGSSRRHLSSDSIFEESIDITCHVIYRIVPGLESRDRHPGLNDATLRAMG